MNNTFKLGRSITQILPFHRIPIKKQEQKEIITNKLVIAMIITIVSPEKNSKTKTAWVALKSKIR
jgi:hypothetical protein